MLETTVRVCRATCVVLIAAGCAAAAVPGPRIEGTLSGLFMTPEGELVAREVRVTAPGIATAGERLHSLWGRYYLRAEVVAPRPVARITLRGTDGTVLWRQDALEPTERLTLPGHDDRIALHARHGLSWVLELHYADGGRVELQPRLRRVELLPMPAPRIDWLTVRRVAELRDLLRVRGDEVFPGFHADGIAFAIAGPEGDLVLIDHPSPPPDFRRYRGPQPTDAVLHVGAWEGTLPSTAFAISLGDVVTAVLAEGQESFDPSHPEGVLSPNPGDLKSLIHEAIHCAWHNRSAESFGWTLEAEAMRPPPLEARMLRAGARAALDQAVSGPEEQVAERVRDYLALREELEHADAAEAEAAQAHESAATTEGFAIAAEEMLPRLLNQVASDEQAPPAPAFAEVLAGRVEAMRPELPDAVTGWGLGGPLMPPWAHYMGTAQAAALTRLRPDAIRTAWAEDRLLVEQLAHEVGYNNLPEADRAALRIRALQHWGYEERLAEARRTLREGESVLLERLRAARAGQPRVLELCIRFSIPVRSEAQAAGLWPRPCYLTSFDWPTTLASVQLRQPCLVRTQAREDLTVYEVRTVFSGDTVKLQSERKGDEVTLSAGDFKAELRAPVLQADGRRLTISSAVPGGAHGPALALAEIIPPGARCLLPVDCRTERPFDARAIPVHAISSTLTGAFRDWAGLEHLTVDLLDATRAVRLAMVRDTYHWKASACDLTGRTIAGLSLLAEGESFDAPLHGPKVSATASGNFRSPQQASLSPISPHIRGSVEEGWRYALTLFAGDLHVMVVLLSAPTLEAIRGESTRPAGATVRAWPVGHEELAQAATTDEKGVAVIQGIPASRAIVEVTHPEACALRCERPVGGDAGFTIWRHRGMEGEIAWRGECLPDQPPTVEVRGADGGAIAVEVVRREQPDARYAAKFAYSTGAVPAGEYTVLTRWGGHELAQTATVPNDCQMAISRLASGAGVYMVVEGTGGAHHQVRGPSFVFPPQE